MNENNHIVTELVKTNFIPNYAKKRFFGDETYIDDIVQDVYLILLEHPLLTEIYSKGGLNKVRAFASGIIQRHLAEKGKGHRLYVRERNWCNNEIPSDETIIETI